MRENIAGFLAKKFINNPITPVLAIIILFFGAMAIMLTPREENPQIDVPSANVIVSYPGANSKEVQNIIVEPLARILKEMTEVDDIYSVAQNSLGVVTVKFNIGENKEISLLKLYDRVSQNLDLLPDGVMPPIVKPIDIDEVPILTFALSSENYDDSELYRMTQRLLTPISKVENVSVVRILGGHKRQFNISIDPEKLSAYNLSLSQITDALKRSNRADDLSSFADNRYAISVEFDGFIKSKSDIENLILAIYENRPIYLKDIASIEDGIDLQNKNRSYISKDGKQANQVTIYVAKKRGSNAVVVSENVLKVVESLKSDIPKDVEITTTRDDGKKANEAVNELIHHLVISIIIVVLLLVFMLGLRESLIVSVAIPLVLSITLFVGMLYGQSINRITLFALILSLGLLVDDAIVVIENIHRHFSYKVKEKYQTIIEATNEIGNPTSLATFTVMFAFFPMAFVTGMMGPYMAPIPFNVPIAMLSSLVIAYIFTPWASMKFLKIDSSHQIRDFKESKIYKIYHSIVNPMLQNRALRYMFMFGVITLFLLSLLLPIFEIVKFKMLPGANKNTFNITIDLPIASSIDETAKAVNCVEAKLKSEKEIKDFESFIGSAGVIDFNGLLRGANMKSGENIAEIRVNLIEKEHRNESSMEFVSRVRPILQECKSITNANIKLVEDPPGPPVIATLLTEIKGENQESSIKLGEEIQNLYHKIDRVVDIDIMADESVIKYVIKPDLKKAQLVGISPEQIANVLHIGLKGSTIGIVHLNEEKEQVKIFVRYAKEFRDEPSDLEKIKIKSQTTGKLVPLSEIAEISENQKDLQIMSKNLNKVVMVTAEMDKRGSLYALIDLFGALKSNVLDGYKITYDGNPRLSLKAVEIASGESFDIEFTGEWEITFDVFRDLGSAFGFAVLIIYFLLVAYYGNFGVPGIVLVAVPLTFIGVLGGHALMDIFTPTYFTATSMIGFIALAGIVIRNSLLLVDFIDDLLKNGVELNEAIITAGSTRFRPILLTTLAIILASFVIVLDPVWQGLAVSLIFGVAVSTALTLFVVPMLYWRRLKRKI